ncbi:hypothetical protein C2845_PM17G04140 [Panicum miliaceum]|uniref:RNase H type-1 domain-containing protein n=1 Tax=Panicum miliaceum TaxID=4540 RepID=A0A3L6Q1X5_PANMI|nr:hypothetical protein C2845_PM17G04140 [Panicum miliaceum]
MVKGIWRHMNLEDIRSELLSLNNAQEVVSRILSMEEKHKLPVIGLLWAWLNARNRCNVGEPLMKMEAISFSAREVISDGGGACAKPARSSVFGRKTWRPPPVDVLKINFDGSFRAAEKDGAWGFVIRHSDEQVIVAGSGRLSAVNDALSAGLPLRRPWPGGFPV